MNDKIVFFSSKYRECIVTTKIIKVLKHTFIKNFVKSRSCKKIREGVTLERQVNGKTTFKMNEF